MDGEKTIEVRDARKRQMFKVDDVYIDRYAKHCGVNATAVYASLCRHASGKQESHPSIRLIMDQHGLKSHHTVLKALRKLSYFGIIQIIKRRNEKNKRQMVNIYVLTDVQSWKPMAPDATGADGISCTEPMAFHAQKPMAPDATEGYTGIQGYTEKDVATSATVPVSTQGKKQCSYDGCSSEPYRERETCPAHTPMSCEQFVEWCRASPGEHVKIIGEWADEVRPSLKTLAQWNEFLARNLRPAKRLTPFSSDQISDAMERIERNKKAGWLTEFTLETVLKYVTEPEK